MKNTTIAYIFLSFTSFMKLLLSLPKYKKNINYNNIIKIIWRIFSNFPQRGLALFTVVKHFFPYVLKSAVSLYFKRKEANKSICIRFSFLPKM